MSQAFLNSASSFIQLLKENDQQLNVIGLQKLLPLIDTHWQEISEYLDLIEEFYENENFPERKLAAFIASKIYYNLQEEKESLDYALKSGEFFNIEDNSQYTECLVNTCITNYMNAKQQNYDDLEKDLDNNDVGPEYEQIVDHMFKKSIDTNNLKDAIGLAIECRREDVITKILEIDLTKNPNNNELLQYLFQVSVDIIKNRKFRIEILKLITQYYSRKQLTGQDYLNLCLCYFQYDDYEKVAQILNNLISNANGADSQNLLIAYQIANEISENENQYFINRVISAFPIENDNPEVNENRQRLVRILNGEVRKRLNQIFLQTKNYTDPALLTKLKDLTNQRQSIQVGGVSFANGILNAGTNDQSFLEKNMEWLQNNKFWNKFSMVAALGVIHKGSQKDYKKIFEDFLPGSTTKLQQGKNPNSNGGALYGLGLMHEGSKNPELMNYFKSILSNGEYIQNETIVHGCALGMGLVGLASEDANIQTDLSNILSTSQSVSAEAASISIGIVMAGSGKQDVIEELLNFAEETDKDKIARGCALAVAMILFGQEQAADPIIKTLLTSQNNIFRYGGCMALGMAYIGTGNDLAIKKLLNLAVIDVSDDVRRQAVISLAFVMFKVPEEYIKMVKLLSNSYSPHVRYGTALGLGIVCAGTGNAEAYELLEPLLTDNSTPFVRQAAYLGTAMLFQLSNKNNEPKLEKFIKTLEDCLSKKSDDPIVKLGAYLSYSILQSGGQNQVIKLASQSGFPKLGACIGMLAFSNFWHWYPLVHFYTLALQPSAIIGVNEKFRIPKNFEFKSNVKPILTDYVPHAKKEDDKKTEKKSTVSLSITNRAKARAQIKDSQKEGDASRVDNSSLKRVTSKLKSDSKRQELEALNQKKQTEKMELEEQAIKEKEKEATSQKYTNPSRVLEKYKKHIQFLPGRYQPIIKERKSGIIFLKDTQPGDEEEYIGDDILAAQQEQNKNKQNENKNDGTDDGPDVEPPEDFIFSMEEQQK